MLLFAAACVLPVSEIYRAQEPVFVDIPGAVSVRACTWSKWNAVAAGCANLAEGEREGDGPFTVKEFSNTVTVIFGEAPLMQTLYVACVDKAPRGSVLYAWDASFPIEVRIADGKHDTVGEHALDAAERDALARGLCDGSVVAMKKP